MASHKVVEAIVDHRSGAKSVPVARVGRHVVRRVDLRLARAHRQVAEILRGLDGPVDNETLGLLRGAFAAGGVKGITRDRIADAIVRLSKGVEPLQWVHARRGPDMAAAELMSAVGPRSARYVFLVKQIQASQDEGSPGLEDAARGRPVTRRMLTEYILRLLDNSPRTVKRVMGVLYGKGGASRMARRKRKRAQV